MTPNPSAGGSYIDDGSGPVPVEAPPVTEAPPVAEQPAAASEPVASTVQETTNA